MAERPRIGLVGCVKTKLSREAPAQDLYVSDLFRGRRSHVERTCDRWYILSAKHHLLRPEEVIAPYDLTLVDFTDAERRRWSQRVLEELAAELGTLSGYEFELHAGDEYRSYGLRDGLDRAGALSVYPVAGLRIGDQLEYYSRGGATAAEGVPAPGPAPRGLEHRPERAKEAARRLWAAWTGDGIFGVRSMPESRPPSGVERGSREHALFITLTVAIDYMRDAAALWEASRTAFDADGTRWLFNPAAVATAEPAVVKDVLAATRIAKRPDQDARIWQTVSASLQRRFRGDPRQIAAESAYRAPAMIDALRRIRDDFPWLKGPKIAPLWVRMMADEVGLTLRDLDQVPIPVDIHIARTTFACGGLVGSFRGTVGASSPTIQNLWHGALSGTDLYPLQLDQALWLQSREGCSRRRGDSCPREAECAIADLCVAGTIRLDDDSLVVETHLTNGPPPSRDTGVGVTIAQVWERILAHAGEGGFRTRQGVEITYDADADEVVVRHKRGARIPRAHFQEALAHVPLQSLWDVPERLWGRSYIFAILMDERIRAGDW